MTEEKQIVQCSDCSEEIDEDTANSCESCGVILCNSCVCMSDDGDVFCSNCYDNDCADVYDDTIEPTPPESDL